MISFMDYLCAIVIDAQIAPNPRNHVETAGHTNLEPRLGPSFHRSLVFTVQRVVVEQSQRGVERTLVGLAVERTLLQFGKPIFDKVEGLLRERYHASIMDSYDHPEYLSGVLRDVVGDSYSEVTTWIEEFLLDFRYQVPIDEFITKISR